MVPVNAPGVPDRSECHDMELSDLKIFKAVVDEGGIIRAGRALHRVPSNVSARVKQLELSIGARLFYRSKQRLTLTPHGERLLDYAERLLRLSEEAYAVVRGAAPEGVLKLGSLESTAAGRLPGVLAAYHRAFPEVRVELVTGTNDAMLAAVQQRRVEAAFVAEAPERSEQLSVLPLFAERLVVISAAAHRPIRRAADVHGDSLIAFPAGCAYRRVFERWLGRKGLATLRVLEMSSYHAMVACVAAGAGIALVPESVLAIVDHRHVVRHSLPRVHESVVTGLVWRTQEVSATLVALIEFFEGGRVSDPALPGTRANSRRGGIYSGNLSAHRATRAVAKAAAPQVAIQDPDAAT
ncbi:MAG TPA: LysR substrate-binding domain-containing protein [Steroidobacteraceae bacterium]|jgi:DNA-binding transcriptional LysR family regulator